MDRYFYSVELDDNGNKIVHLSGNVYYHDCSEDPEQDYRYAEYCGFYLTISEIAELVTKNELFETLYEEVKYEGYLTEEEAIETCNKYFMGQPGINLHIKDVNENTPCGDYWFE